MGVNIRDIIPKKQIDFIDLKGKVIAIDAFNTIYQFLSTIRQYDGTPLEDSKGRVTSHLSGLFYRNISLLSEGLKLIYVFDGLPPKQKAKTAEMRSELKAAAQAKYDEAKEKEDIEQMRKFSQQTSKINQEIIDESKELLEAMGIAVIQAPSEGEAQASFMARHKQIYAAASQDYDCLMFGAPLLIQNLTLARKRKTVSGFIEIFPQLIELEKVLNHLQINQEQLICLGILVGTDYNPGGIKGIGQKKALDIVRKFQSPALIFEQFKDQLDFDWPEIFQLFKKPNIKHIEEIDFPTINHQKIRQILTEHDFTDERINKQLEKLEIAKKSQAQKTLF